MRRKSNDCCLFFCIFSVYPSSVYTSSVPLGQLGHSPNEWKHKKCLKALQLILGELTGQAGGLNLKLGVILGALICSGLDLHWDRYKVSYKKKQSQTKSPLLLIPAEQNTIFFVQFYERRPKSRLVDV